jgi:ATP-dependent 26S proteasome regulatory subunit
MSRDRDALVAALVPLRARLGGAEAEPAGVDPRSALALTAAVFGLDAFERDVLTLAAGCELDASFAAAVAEAQGDPARRSPSVGLALARLEGAAFEAFAPDRPLRRFQLIELTPAGAFTASPYRLAERVLHALLGVDTIDETLRALAAPLAADEPLSPTHARLAAALESAFAPDAPPCPLLMLTGEDTGAKRSIAARLARGAGLRALAVDAAHIPEPPAERDALARLWEREYALGGALLTLICDDDLDPARRRAALAWAERLQAPVVVCLRERAFVAARPVRAATVDRPPRDEQRGLWRAALGTRAAAYGDEVERIVNQFSLDAAAISRVAATAEDGAIWDEVRRETQPALDELAQRLPGRADWGDLVLPAAQLATLREIAAQVRRRATVYETWGFGRAARGLGVSVLFSGPSGAGKTLAAEVLGRELQLDVYRVDLAQVVSKYIGETEKNLRRVFDAADAGSAVLLFDEADALFGKRTEVHDSHDRYANIEVSYLLQRMESYRGLAILTTNFKGAIDAAFLRRLRFVVPFPFPDAADRAKIWRAAFPPQTPREGLDYARLAQLNIPGGSIAGIALNASFMAAEHERPVGMAHVLSAARSEYSKLERSLTEAEIAGWR